jgi:catechol 2,3-dioxygenase-like lactoylglutathione lyase family enzyme
MLLLDHVSIGVPDLDAARPFYDAIMDALGPRKVYDRPDAVGYGERCSASDIQSSCLAVYLDPGPVQPGPDVHRSSGLDERPAALARSIGSANGSYSASALIRPQRKEPPPLAIARAEAVDAPMDQRVKPPSMVMLDPVMYPASSLAM